MTRLKPTESEVEMERVLLRHLRSSDPSAGILARDSSDKPDLAFTYESQVVACECVQIPPSEVFQWVHKHFANPADKLFCNAVVWAEEPHSWVREAIRSKRSKIPQYRNRISADEVWLLIHTPISDTQTFVRGAFAWESQMLRYGACEENHEFDRIFFWEPKSNIQQIHKPGQSTPPVTFNFSGGYPSRSFVLFGGFPFTTTRPGEPPQTYQFEPIRPTLIVVPPIDAEFAKHQPKFRDRSYTVTIVAHDTRADMSCKINWDE